MSVTYTVRRPVVNAYLVREQDRRLRRELALVLLVVLAAATGFLGYVWVTNELVRIGYRIGALEHSLERLSQHERRLRLEAATLTSPMRLEERAGTELGMQAPTLDQVVFLEATP